MITARAATRPIALRRLRVSWSLPRIAFYVLVAAGLISSVRATVAPVRPPAVRLPTIPRVDLEAQGFAERFARAYLTYDARRPDAYAAALGAFFSDPSTNGLELPGSGTQTVLYTTVVAQQPFGLGGEIYTVAVQTNRGLLYLAAPVSRNGSGALQVAGYPALVGGPAASPHDVASPLEGLPDLSDPQLQTLLERALGNYLADHGADLQADLAPGVSLTVPSQRLSLQQLVSAKLAPGGRTVYATVSAQDGGGAIYTLTYEVGFTMVGGRPYVSSIENSSTG